MPEYRNEETTTPRRTGHFDVAGDVKAFLRRHAPAIEFLQEALRLAVQRVHGERSETEALVEKWMDRNGLDHEALALLYAEGKLPEPIRQAVEQAGGPTAFNRHVSGQQLCWAMRDLAIQRWGPLARTVLRRWHIRSTDDIGRLVFALIECGMMRRQETDRLEDFHDVFDFDEAFGNTPIELSAADEDADD